MKTCLVVDDSSIVRKMARRILEGLDFQVVEAEDGSERFGRLQARDARGDPARLEHARDGRLPLPRAICAACPAAMSPRWCSAPPKMASIISTRALDGGANEYIMKPFDKDIIAAKFQEVGLIELTGIRARFETYSAYHQRGSRDPARL